VLRARPHCLDTTTLLTISLGVLTTVASATSIYLFADDLRSRRRFGWKQVDRLVLKLIEEMRARGFRPDLVIGVGRGGAIVAAMLAGNMGHLPLVVLDTILEHEEGVSTVTFRFPDSCPPVRDRTVLAVVGELYSGEDLRHAIQFIARRHPRELKTASLLTHPAASVRPEFIGLLSDKPLTAPWRLTDAYKMRRL